MSTREPAVIAECLTKTYRVHQHGGEGLWKLLRGETTWTEHTALDNFTLTIPRGQALGIVGRNGAGKSTLLKILAGALTPSSGTAIVNGSISSLLELGSGFHPDFTGRQNVFLGGLCIGMTRKEIEERFDDILAFADLPDVIDRPFRTYSTGMQTRLSFSVAVALDPDVMIVDEALSVGDAKFQAKCFRRFEELKARGTTILLVSHSMPSIVGFCDRAIILENGRLIEDGDPRMIDKGYQRLLFDDALEAEEAQQLQAPITATFVAPPPRPPAIADADYAKVLEEVAPDQQSIARDIFGSGEARITSAAVVDENGRPTTLIETGRPFGVVLGVEAIVDVPDLVVGILLRTPRGMDVFGIDFQTDSDVVIPMKAGEKIVVRLQGIAWLASADYMVTVGLAHGDKRKMDLRYDYLHFRVTGTEMLYTASLVNIEHSLHVENMTLKDWVRHAEASSNAKASAE